MPKSALTGTQKKAQKRDIKFQQKLQEKYLRELSMDRPTRRALSAAKISDLDFNKDIQKMFKKEFESDKDARRAASKAKVRDIEFTKDLQKMFKKEFEAGKDFRRTSVDTLEDIAKGKTGVTTSLSDLMKDFQKTQSLGQKYFEPMKQQALSEFDQYTRPDVVGGFAGGGAGSSALNQALAAARVNLSGQLASNLAGLNLNLGQNLMNTRQQNQLSNLQARLQSAGAGYGTQLQPAFTGLAGSANYGVNPGLGALGVPGNYGVAPSTTGLASTNPYLQKSGQSSGLGGPLIAGGLSAFGSFAGSEAGAGALASLLGLSTAAASSRDVKENIQDYDKGLDEIRGMEVKRYNYIEELDPSKKNRIGLIAEEMPKDIQDQLNGINAVDVYGLVALLVNAVKQLDQKVKLLEAR